MENNLPVSEQLKIFTMQNLMLEADLASLENSGIEIGHIQTIKKQEVVDKELFDFDIRKKAKKMADFYSLYFSLENSIRRLISERLEEKHGSNWWNEQIPQSVKDNVTDKQTKEKDTVLSIRSDEPLTYTNFGELIDIFNANWDDFDDTIRSRKAMQQTLSQLNQLRNIIAHSCELNDDEISRFELLIKDWQRIQM